MVVKNKKLEVNGEKKNIRFKLLIFIQVKLY